MTSDFEAARGCGLESWRPVYVEISPLHRLVTIVARGKLTSDEIRSSAQKLSEARVRRFAKIVEVAGAHLDLEPADIAQLAQTLRATRTVPDRSPLSSPPTEVPSLVNSPRPPHMKGRSMCFIACMRRVPGSRRLSKLAPKQRTVVRPRRR